MKNIFQKTSPQYAMLPEYRHFIESYREYRNALNMLRTVRADIRDIINDYKSIKEDQRKRAATNQDPIDPLSLKIKVDEIHRKLSDLRITEHEAEEVYFTKEKVFRSKYKEFAEMYDLNFLRPLIEKHGTIMNELQTIEQELENALREMNSNDVLLEDSNISKIHYGKKMTHVLDLTGYSIWRQRI
jgi:hypothetical protein